MKKNLLFGLAVLGTASMLCGFDSAQTADDVLNNMQQAETDMQSMSMDMSMDVDVAVNVGDGTTTSTIAVAAGGDFSIDYILDPMAMSMEGSMSLSTFGQNEDITMKMYAVTNENGDFETYTYTADSTSGEEGWVYEESEGMDMSQLMELSKSFTADTYKEWGITFELAPEAADVNGTECYVLTTSLDSDTISTILNKVTELAGEAAVSQDDLDLATSYMTYLNGLKMNLEYYVDAATYVPVSMHIDMNGSDLSALNSLLGLAMGGSEGTSVELQLNVFSIDCTMSYDDVTEITVPQEALDAVASGEATSVNDIVSELEDAAEAE